METGLSCQGHKSILASWFVHWISFFYYCTFLHRTSLKHLVGTFQRKECHSSQRKDFSSPHPQKQPTSHQSPFSQIWMPISIDKPHSINKTDSCLPCYIHIYTVSLMLFDLWVIWAPDGMEHYYQLEQNQWQAGIVPASSPFCQLTSLLTHQLAAVPFTCQTMQWFWDAYK